MDEEGRRAVNTKNTWSESFEELGTFPRQKRIRTKDELVLVYTLMEIEYSQM